MKVITEIDAGTIESPPWPVDTLGNATVPRIGDDVVLPGAHLVVRSVVWNPLGDPEGWPERGLAPGEPFVYVLLALP